MTNKNIVQPAYNSNINSWNIPVNANFANIDAAFGAVQGFNLAGASGTINVSASTFSGPYPANTPSYVPLIWEISGAMASGVTLQLPTSISGQWTVYNTATGGNVTVQANGLPDGIITTLVPNQSTILWSDGNSVVSVDQIYGSGAQTGDLKATYSGVPAGWLACDGSTYAVANYPGLAALYGNWGGSNDGTNFTVPDLRGYTLAMYDGGTGRSGIGFGGFGGSPSNVMSYGQMPVHNHGDSGHSHGASTGSHSHSITDNGHSHGLPGSVLGGFGEGAVAGAGAVLVSGNTGVSGTGISINAVGNIGVSVNTGFANITNAGGNQPFPVVQSTAGVYYVIKY